MTRRIQRKRTKGWRMPDGAVYVGRPTKWGNPHAGDPNLMRWRVIAQEAVCKYDKWLHERPELMADAKRELRGRDLACWCDLGAPCHADVLLEIANG